MKPTDELAWKTARYDQLDATQRDCFRQMIVAGDTTLVEVMKTAVTCDLDALRAAPDEVLAIVQELALARWSQLGIDAANHYLGKSAGEET